MKATECRLCDGACAGADLSALLSPDLDWLWSAVASAADRRGDPHMLSGPAVTVEAPSQPRQRAAAAGLIRGTPRPRQRLRIELPVLTQYVHARGPSLSPGAVAAHATGRALAGRTENRRQRDARAQQLSARLHAACDRHAMLRGRAPEIFEHLRRTGWVTRLDSHPNAGQLIDHSVDVTAAVLQIPEGERFDRRLLVPDNPHALDEGTPLAGVTLTLLTAIGRIAADQPGSTRSLWAQAGVDCDQLMGGLTTLGIVPAGWQLPIASTCTVPPRELAQTAWPTAPYADAWVFVTENPSVLAAAADLVVRNPANAEHARLICTMGNPSATEIAALARLSRAGWKVAVRADFDPAGIRTVTALLNGIPGSRPWRMSRRDYLNSNPNAHHRAAIPPTPWEPQLADEIAARGDLAFEEALLPDLLADLQRGRPAITEPDPHDR